MFEELLSKISVHLNRHHIPYMIIGGQAVLLYGEPRLTIDFLYIRRWLREFDASTEEKKDYSDTFETILNGIRG